MNTGMDIFKKNGYQNQTDFVLKIKTVMDHLATDVVNLIYASDDLMRKESSVKAGMIVSLSAIETLARWWEVYNGGNEKNGERFKRWLNTFVFTPNNKVYEELKACNRISVENLWKVRNAIVHACGLPTNIDGNHFVLVTNGKKTGHPHEKIWDQVINDTKAIYIDFSLLNKAVIEGATLHALEMKHDGDNLVEKYIKCATNMLNTYTTEGGIVKNLNN